MQRFLFVTASLHQAVDNAQQVLTEQNIGGFQGHTIPLEAAEVKHHHDLFDVELQQNFHFWVLLKTLVDLRFMPNDVHEARKWSCGTSVLLSLCVYNVDITPGLINKVLSLLLIFDLAHTSSLVCILFVALCPYVSMGIVSCLGQLLTINNV